MGEKYCRPTTHCPTCGQELPELPGVSVDLDSNTVIVDGMAVRVGPRQAELMHILIRRAPAWVSGEAITGAIYASQGGGRNDTTVAVHKLRRKLAGLPVAIETSNRGPWPGSYRLIRSTSQGGIEGVSRQAEADST